MTNKIEKIDHYIAAAAPFAQPILAHLRKIIHKTCPDVTEDWKWSFPHFIYKGAILCSMAAFKQHCSFGFWKAAIMQDDTKVLSVSNREGMGHLGKIESLGDLPDDEVLIALIKTAMKLNEDGVKLPSKTKNKSQKKLDVPPYFQNELDKNEKASATFYKFSYSHQKEYLEWITEAKTEVTRIKRMTTALEWLENGKNRNWKYNDC